MKERLTEEEPLLTDEEAAVFLSTTTRHIKRLINERSLGYVKVGRYVRFRPADLARYIERHHTPAEHR